MDNIKAAAYIRRYEGFSKLPYKCPTGHLTIGYGHNLENGISANAALFILQEDLTRAEQAVKDAFPWWWKLDDARQFVLVDMAFNMGLAGLKGFKKCLPPWNRATIRPPPKRCWRANGRHRWAAERQNYQKL